MCGERDSLHGFCSWDYGGQQVPICAAIKLKTQESQKCSSSPKSKAWEPGELKVYVPAEKPAGWRFKEREPMFQFKFKGRKIPSSEQSGRGLPILMGGQPFCSVQAFSAWGGAHPC